MATPPTFQAEYEASSWTTSTTPKTVTPTTAVGDKLVIAAITADQLTQLTHPPTGNSLTYTLAQSIEAASSCQVYGWTAPDNTGGTGWTLSVSETGAGDPPWGFTALRFSGSDGFGASAKAGPTSGAPSLDITTTQDNSAIVVMVGDWAAVDGASRTWRTVNGTTPTAANGFERSYARDAAQYTIYVAYYPDAGAAGVKTVGLSAPGGQTYSIIAIEVKGTAGAPPILVPSAPRRAHRRVMWTRRAEITGPVPPQVTPPPPPKLIPGPGRHALRPLLWRRSRSARPTAAQPTPPSTAATVKRRALWRRPRPASTPIPVQAAPPPPPYPVAAFRPRRVLTGLRRARTGAPTWPQQTPPPPPPYPVSAFRPRRILTLLRRSRTPAPVPFQAPIPPGQLTYIFRPPTSEGPKVPPWIETGRPAGRMPMSGPRARLGAFTHGTPTGISVLRENGVFVQVQNPLDTRVAAAERAYLGGYEYVVTGQDAVDLLNAGYVLDPI